MKMLNIKKVQKNVSKLAMLESNHNNLAQYGRRNNVAIGGIAENVSDDDSESTVISVLSDIGAAVEPKDIQACHRIGKAKSKSKKTIVRFVNRHEKLRKDFNQEKKTFEL